MINSETIYNAEQEFKRFEMIMNTKTYLTKEEYDFCFGYDKDIRKDTTYIGNYSKLGDYLNLRVYSEHDHEKREYEMEIGG
jgi:hypothetical protein